MSDWSPGEGWREVRYGAELEGHEHISWESTGLAGGTSRMWIREAPVLLLPTAPYTVIRAQVSPDEPDVTLVYDGTTWLDIESGITARRLDRITSFEVLSEPTPRVALFEEQQRTARDILRHIWNENGGPVNGYADLAKRYGVES